MLNINQWQSWSGPWKEMLWKTYFIERTPDFTPQQPLEIED